MNALKLFKGLADESRLQIIGLLKEKPYCVEDIAESLKLAVSTVSVHLKKLQEAGLVYAVKVQYYSVYHLKTELLEQRIADVLPRQYTAQPNSTETLRQKVLKTYFQDGKVTRLPTQNKKRWIVYLEIIRLFAPGQTYTEREINELISAVYEDYCLVRRELIDEGVLARQNGIYRLVENFAENPGFYQKIWAMSEGQN
ncbi:MAG TPA: metalloregulator ArsR/SmtB family transcription factor [Candidatus Cloacimonadota bacterium]|nr:metalloregulator ArsR/SmtB family transcription factor [Candidatus Cloacimonadota bacterium]HPS39834.1 metalloregulator ArsR/SmtB family transcription factor [Candidatus Cloacimonadota bacterium]